MPSTQRLKDFFDQLFLHGEKINFRSLPAVECPVYTYPDDLEAIERFAARASGMGQGVYCGVGAHLTGRGKGEVQQPRMFFIDCDPRSPDKEWCPSDEDILRLVDQVAGLAAPTMTVFSGRGVHFYFKCSAAEGMTDDEWTDYSRRFVTYMATNLNDTQFEVDTGVHDIPRIMRLPGCVNHRTGRVAEVLSITDAVHDTLPQASVGATRMATSYIPDGDIVTEGSRDSYLTHAAVTLKRHLNLMGRGLEEALVFLDETFCDPPLGREKCNGLAKRMSVRQYDNTIVDGLTIETDSDLVHPVAQAIQQRIRLVVRPGRKQGRWMLWDQVKALWVDGSPVSMVQDVVDDFAGRANLPNRMRTLQSTDRLVSRLERQYEYGYVVQPGEMDNADDIIVTRNGHYYDLRAGMIVNQNPDLNITRALGCDLVPDAECPTWQRFLDTSMPNKEEQRALGKVFFYCLSGWNTMRSFFVNIGTGRNGKGVAWTALTEIMGDLAVTGNYRAVACDDKQTPVHDSALANQMGARVAVYNELPAESKLHAQNLKRLVGEEGEIFVRLAGAPEPTKMRMTAKHVIVTNDLPEIRAEDAAITDRLVVIPWTVRFKDGEADPALPAKLRREYSGILNWILSHREAALEDMERGPVWDTPESWALPRTEYVEASNPQVEFIERCIEHLPGGKVGITALTDRFHELGIGRRPSKAQMAQWAERLCIVLRDKGWDCEYKIAPRLRYITNITLTGAGGDLSGSL
jgi:P4 family phage/plasmid primase-like protien